MKKYYFFFLFIWSFFQTSAQTRYLDSLFVPIKSQQDITYGQADALNFPYLLENWTYSQDLKLDLYEPQGDTISNRPCIVFAHGGAFLLGSKTDVPVVKFCEQMTTKGYVVAAIEYRLGFNLIDSASAERAVYRAVQDMKAAIRFVKNSATGWNIDPSRVFAAGNSAGSVMAIHTAYFDEAERNTIQATFNTPDLGCLSCSGNTYTFDDVPLAIANLWGAIVDTSFIGIDNNIPMVSFHGTDDDSVFPDENRPFSYPNFPKMQGSDLLTARLDNLNINTEYHSFIGQGHEPWGIFGNTPYFDTIVTETAQFFYQFLTPPVSTIPVPRHIQFNIFPNPATIFLNVDLYDTRLDEVEVMIVNVTGQVVSVEQFSNVNSKISIPVQHLQNGWYGIVLRGKDFNVSSSFLKQ